jgi:PAS domain S-box-containing protein
VVANAWGRHDGGETVSEASERSEFDAALVEQVLAAVTEPALVCDADGVVRAENDAAGGLLAESSTGRPVDAVVDWHDEDPVERAVHDGESRTADGSVDGGRHVTATARPLTRGSVVGAVVTVERDDPDLYEAALAAAPDSVYVFDTDDRIRHVSDVFESLTGVSTDEVTGRDVGCLTEYGIVDEDTIERARGALERTYADEAVTFVARPSVESGTIVVENHLAPVRRDGDVVGAVCVSRDVTERVRAESALRESRERLETLLETLPVAMLVVGADGRIDRAQGLDVEALGCEHEELVGLDIEALVPDYESVVAACRGALDGTASTVTATIGDRTYEAFLEPVRTDGEVTAAIVAAVDVTDREERERELAATNERLDLALDNTDAGVWEWHVGQNRVYWHEITSRLLGVDPDVAYRTREEFRELVHPEDRERVLDAATEVVETDGELEVEFRLADDPDRWFRSEAELQRVADGPDRLVGTIRDVTERKEQERELVERERRLRAVIEGTPDPIAMKDREGRYRVVNEAALEGTDLSRTEVRGKTAHEVFGDDLADPLERQRLTVLEEESARVTEDWLPYEDTEHLYRVTTAPVRGPGGDVQGTVAIIRDITEIERQKNELERLTAIQRLVHESVRALTDASTRAEIGETVCDRLAGSAFYEAAWVGSHDHSAGEVTPDYVAGGEDIRKYLSEVTITVDTSESGQGPGGTAYRSGEVQVTEDVRTDPAFAPFREAALEHGFESVAVVPLTHGSTTHGILALYTGRTGAFGEREVAGFETLGEAVGFALSATQHRRLLEADSVLELEFEVTSADPFIVASAEHDCRFVFSNAVLGRDGTVINYLTVEDADPGVGAEVAREFDALESVRRLDGADGPHFEMHWSDSVFEYLIEAGGRGMRGVIEDGTGTMVVEAPGDIDVRQVIDAMLARFDEVGFVAKRERESRDAAWWRPHGDIGATLTDRQRAVLQTAYYSGYYEWPRETDAETLADSMGVASTTLLQHLRKGHGRVLEALFDA